VAGVSEITIESIAKHCIDDNITSGQIACLLEAQAELTRLRRIEAAFNGVTDLPLPRPWRVLAAILRDEGYKRWAKLIDDIADALEAK